MKNVPVYALLLGGCVATTGGLQLRGNGLPDQYADIANEMVTLARQRCVKMVGLMDQPKDDWNKVRKMDGNDWLVRRFYTSNTSWVKAEAVSQGVTDDLYFDPTSKNLICGSHLWGKYESATPIRFIEYGAKPAATPLPTSNQPPRLLAPEGTTSLVTAPKGPVAQTLGEKRTLAVRWDGYASLMVGEATIQQNKSLATLKVQLPNNEGTCTGISQITNSPNGIWTVSCTNNLSATGTLVANGTGRGATGSGKDVNGRAVEFTMGGSN